MDDCKKTLLNGQFVFVDKTTVVCKFCNKHFKYHHSTSTLQYHLRNKHPFCSSSQQTNGDCHAQKRQLTLDDVNERGKPMKAAKYDQITNCIVKWIAQDCRPVNIVEDHGLQELIRAASGSETYVLPSRKTVNTRVAMLYESEKVKVQLLLDGAQHVGLTTDYWTSVANESFLGVTAHFLDNKWDYHAVVIGVYAMEERHFAEAVSRHIRSVINDWMLTTKVTTIGTDNAFNMISAVKQMPFESLPCIAHALQLSVNKGLYEAGADVALAKCRKIVGHFKHSAANFAELKQELSNCGMPVESPVQDVPTRWNSTFSMIERFLKQKDALLAVLRSHNHKHNLSLPTEAELDKLRLLKALLEPCKTATELLGGEKYVSCSVVLPCLMYLSKQMKISDEDPAYIVRFKTAFCNDLEKRRSTCNNHWLKLATALDPRFKKLKCLQKEDRDSVWSDMKTKVAQLISGKQQEPDRSNTELPSKKAKLFDYSSDTDDETESTETDASVAVERYKSEPEVDQDICPLQWWLTHNASHPLVATLAVKFLSSPATTVPCERLFSIAGNILNKKRTSLSASNLNKLVSLHSWLPKQHP